MRRSDAYITAKMKPAASWLPMPLQISLMTLLMFALAASTLLAMKHAIPVPRPAYAVAGDATASQATPYGSSAALRNLLF